MGEDIVLMRDEREVIAWVGDIDGQMIDNAHLISGAPEMLEALEALVSMVNSGEYRQEILNRADAAIRKARGKQYVDMEKV